MSKIYKLSKTLLLLLFVSINLFSQKRAYPVVGTEGSKSKQAKTRHTFSQERLDENAINKGLGFKTANLMELENVVENLATQLPAGYHVTVPDFVGITSKQIQAFFEKNGLDIQDSWNAIIMSIDTDNPIQWLKDSENRKNFIASLVELANDIENLMISNDDLNLQDVNTFLGKASENNWRLMVRSTGKEDTKELPNAGGNHSEPNVLPSNISVINSIKKVVASYFKEKSLSQRIDAGDKEIFFDPLTPVLLQRMIGEKLGGTERIEEIPVGCVVYTGEVEGSTPGVVTIQSAFGHNEGVVNSEVAVDTYYVKDKNIRPIIQIKNQRIIPIESGEEYGLQLVNNPDELKEKQVLSDEDILAIDIVANAVHDYYNEAMDIELVFEPSSKTIYLVQARPLQVVDAVFASYIKDIKKIDDEKIAKCSTVSAAGGAVRHITNKNQIITASTLQSALDKYLSGNIDQTQVVAVIVQGQAEPTSHAAAIFRGAGKCILTCDDIENLEKWLNENSINLFVDVQREMVVNEKDLMETDNFIKTGWFKHPISQRLSISGPAFFGPLQKADEKLKRKTYQELIEVMKEGEDADAKKALNALMWKLSDKLYKKKQAKLSEKRLEQLQKAYNVSTRLAQEMLVDNIFEKKPQDIERLYAINFLEAILFQPKETSKYVNIFSVDSVTKEYKAIEKFIKEKLQPLLGEKADKIIGDIGILSVIRQGVDAALTEELENKWINFVNNLFISGGKENIKKLKNIFEIIKELEVLPVWMNTIFANEAGDTLKVLDRLANQINESKAFLQIILNKKKWLNNFDSNKFKDPKNYKKLLSSFDKKIRNYFVSDDFVNSVKTGSLLSKEVAISFMLEIIEEWDSSIKALKGSPQYGLKDKVNKFREMLRIYFSFLENWIKLPKEIPNKKQDLSFQQIFNFIESLLSRQTQFLNNELNNSSDFVLDYCVIGRGGRFEWFSPKTLEDVFTFIHQSLININFIFSSEVYPKIKLPEWVDNISKKLAGIDYSNFWFVQDHRQVYKQMTGAFFSGYEFYDDSVFLLYNFPLGAHSFVFKLKYNKEEQKVFLSGFSYGVDHENRWERSKDFVEVCAAVSSLKLLMNKSFKLGYEFELELTEKSNADSLIFIITELLDLITNKLINLSRSEFWRKEFFEVEDYFFEKIILFFKDKIQMLENVILDLSVKGYKVNWLLGSLLKNIISNSICDIKNNKKIDEILNKFLSVKNDYFVNTLLFLLKNSKDYSSVNAPNIETKLPEEEKRRINSYFVYRFLIPMALILKKDLSSIQIKGASLDFHFDQSLYSILYFFNSEKNKSKKNQDNVISHLNNIYGNNDEKLKKMVLSVVWNYLISDNVVENIFYIVNEVNVSFRYNLFKKIRDLIQSKNEKAISLAIGIVQKVFDSDYDNLKEHSLKRFGLIETMIESGNSESIGAAIKIYMNLNNKDLKKRFENRLSIGLKEFDLKKVLKVIFYGVKDEQVSKAVVNRLRSFSAYEIIKILNIIFAGTNEELKKEFGYRVRDLINSKNEKAIEASIKIINDVYAGKNDVLKKEFSYLVRDLINSKNEKAIEASIKIINDVYAGSNEELKKKFSYLVRDLINSKNEKAIEASIKIINDVYAGSNEELKKEFKSLKDRIDKQ